MDEDLRRPLQAPVKRGVNRKQMITELQEKFQFKDNKELEEHMRKQKQMAMLPPVNSKKKRRTYNHGMA